MTSGACQVITGRIEEDEYRIQRFKGRSGWFVGHYSVAANAPDSIRSDLIPGMEIGQVVGVRLALIIWDVWGNRSGSRLRACADCLERVGKSAR